MEDIKKVMKEQIDYMFLHGGEKSTEIDNRLSALIDEYCKDDEDMDKIYEVKSVWDDLVLARYNFTVNEIMNNIK